MEGKMVEKVTEIQEMTWEEVAEIIANDFSAERVLGVYWEKEIRGKGDEIVHEGHLSVIVENADGDTIRCVDYMSIAGRAECYRGRDPLISLSDTITPPLSSGQTDIDLT
jgi:hypothetical protein